MTDQVPNKYQASIGQVSKAIQNIVLIMEGNM